MTAGYELYRAAFRRGGLIEIRDVDDLIDIAKAFLIRKLPAVVGDILFQLLFLFLQTLAMSAGLMPSRLRSKMVTSSPRWIPISAARSPTTRCAVR